MSLIFSTDFEHGSYLDRVSKTAETNTNGMFRRSERGTAWYNDGTADITLAQSYTLSKDASTIEVWFKADMGFGTGDRWLLGYTSGGNSFLGFNETGDLAIESDTASDYWLDYDESNFVANKWYHLLSVADSGTVRNYLNGVLVETTTPTDDVTFQYIGNYSAKNRDFFGYIGKVGLCNHVFTEKERSNSYRDFLASSPLIEEKCPKQLPEFKPTDLGGETDLLAAYNFKEGGNDTDISGNGLSGTVSGGVVLALNGKKFNGVDGKEVLGNIGNIKTVAFRFKPVTTTEKILEGSANDLLVYVDSGTLTYADYDNAYVDGLDKDTIVADQWQDVAIVSSTNVDNSAVTLALNNTTYGKFEIEDLRFFSEEWTEVQALSYHNQFVRRVVFRESFNYELVGATCPKRATVNSGSFLITEDATSKYLSCATGGNLSYNGVDLGVYKGNGWVDEVEGNIGFNANKTVDDAENLSYADGKLTVTMVVGQKLRSLSIHANDARSANPPFVDDLTMWTNSREGLSMIDKSGNDVEILPAAFLNVNGFVYGDKTRSVERVFDEGSYTFYWKMTQVSAVEVIGGIDENIIQFGSAAAGRGVNLYVDSNRMRLFVGDGVGVAVYNNFYAAYNDALLGGGVYECFLEVDFAASRLRFNIYNSAGVAQGTPVNQDISAVAFNDNDNSNRFQIIGADFAISGFKKFSALKTIAQCRTDTYVTDLQIHLPDIISGTDLSDNASHWSIPIYNTVMNGTYVPQCTWLMDYGYTVWKVPYASDDAGQVGLDLLVPNKADGTERVRATITGYTKQRNVKGNLDYLNLAYCKLRFTDNFFDRSSTIIWNAASRASEHYNASDVKTFHISELNNRTITEFLNAGYRRRFFVNITENPIEEYRGGTGRALLKEILFYATDKIGTDEIDILNYTNSFFAAILDASGSIEYDAGGYVQLGYFQTTTPMITIRIDDGFPDTYTDWYPLLNIYSAPAYLPVTIGTDPDENLYGLTWAEIKTMYDAGWDVGGQGINDDDISIYDIDDAESVIVQVKNKLEEEDMVGNHFVPNKFGHQSLEVREEALKYFKTCHIGYTLSPQTANPKILDMYNLSALRTDISGDFMITEEAGRALIKAEIDDCRDENRWVILFIHEHDGDKEAGMIEILDYAVAQGLDIVTMDEALANSRYLAE